MSVACASILDESLSASILGNNKETYVFNTVLNKPDGTSDKQIPEEIDIVTQTGSAERPARPMSGTSVACKQATVQKRGFFFFQKKRRLPVRASIVNL